MNALTVNEMMEVVAGAKICVRWSIMGHKGKICVSYSK